MKEVGVVKIVLPVVKPVIDCYPDLANMLSILNCEKLADSWIATNFIQLVYRRNEKTSYGSFLDFMRMGNDISVYEHCPYLYVNHIDKYFVEDLFPNIFEFILYCLQKKTYLQMYTNKRYLPQRNPPDYNFMHETFIFGIDTERRVLYLADFYDGKYCQIECDFDSFSQAYVNSFPDNPYYKSKIYLETNLAKYNMNKIILLQYNRHELYRPDVQIIKMKVEDYITGKDSFNRITESYIASGYDFYYGVDFYDQLILDLNQGFFDMRKPHVLLSHKVLLRNQLATMQANNYISQEAFTNLTQQIEALIVTATKLQNKCLMLKLRPMLQEKDLLGLTQGYLSLKEQDIAFMSRILKCLT